MPFTETDFYSASAGSEIFNYFNPFVTKFDSQSFYNFEQDNQPLYDLEERTLGLWEKSTGYATSSLVGMPLVVSATTDVNNRNIFSTLQGAIDALPNVIRTPVMIEVAVSGVLGGLDLNNVRVEEGGVLEIINRGFAKIYSGRGNGVIALGGSDGPASAVGGGGVAALRDRSYMNSISSVDLSATIRDTSALSISANCSSLFDSQFNRTFAQEINFTTKRSRNSRLFYGFQDVGSNIQKFASTAASCHYTPFNYENQGLGQTGSVRDGSVSALDVSAIRGDDGGEMFRTKPVTIVASEYERQMTGLTYANAVSSINIQNCNGPIYIRGFCVDGVSGGGTVYNNSTFRNDIGIKVENSNPIIENCSVTRNSTTGAKFVNSNVVLARGFVANRNYQVGTDAGLASRDSRKTTGLHLVNSEVTLEINSTYASGSDYMFNIQNHDHGAVLENSKLIGGQSRPYTTMNDTTVAFAYNDIGIKAKNSSIALSGNLDVYNNRTGIDLVDSELSTDRMTIENHTVNGLLADNSVIKYNNSLVPRYYAVDGDGKRMTQSLFHKNGIHLNLKNGSRFSYYTDVSNINIPTKFGELRFDDAHGVEVGSLPPVLVDQSRADMIHTRINVSAVNKSAPGIAGGAIKATNGSLVNLVGTQNGATIALGPNTIGQSVRVAGISAENGSKVSFRGPTLVGQFGTCILADNNSVVEFVPHKREDQTVDASGFTLTNKLNHTSVELHNTGGACIAATNNSEIIMEDLGSPNTLSALNNVDYDNDDIAQYVSGGSMQFYPNAALANYAGNHDNLSISDGSKSDDVFTNAVYTLPVASVGAGYLGTAITYNYKLANPFVGTASATIGESISTGGMCVEAKGNSVVKVVSVHFPMGHDLADGTFYDPSGSAGRCNQLLMWNIGDTSKLYASHTALSGTVASATTYHGPRSTFFSGITNEAGQGVFTHEDASAVGFAAGSATPDTSTVSICDLFGLGVNVSSHYISYNQSGINKAITGSTNGFGQLTYQNKGPFRLMFSVNPAVKYLSYLSGMDGALHLWAEDDTRPMQHMAQGYSLSGAVGVPASLLSVSDIHTNLIQTHAHLDQKAEVSGFYYPSAMMDSNRGTNVYLDETAANIFANAKNCAHKPIAGRANPNVVIYKSITTEGGEGSPGAFVSNTLHVGKGLRSINIFDIRRSI